MIGIVSLFEATIEVPSTLPYGVGVSDGFTDGLTVSIGFPPEGSATGLTASAFVQIQPTLKPVVARAATTSTIAPIIRARPLIPGSPPTAPAACEETAPACTPAPCPAAPAACAPAAPAPCPAACEI